MTTHIYLAANKKEAISIAKEQHKDKATYKGVYKYSRGKGNNFYTFEVED